MNKGQANQPFNRSASSAAAWFPSRFARRRPVNGIPLEVSSMRYPNLLRRYLASVIDILTVLFIVYLYSRTPLYSPGGDTGAFVFLGVLASYEPLMTVFYCTLGQAAMRFRVRKAETLARVSIGQAYLRMLIKYLLGVISFLTMPARPDRRAIHDLAAGTIVVEASTAK